MLMSSLLSAPAFQTNDSHWLRIQNYAEADVLVNKNTFQ